MRAMHDPAGLPTVLQRRAALQARSQVLRSRLADDVAVLQRPIRLADRSREAWQWLRANPQAWRALAAIALPLLMRRHTVLATGLKVWGLWKLWRRARPVLTALAALRAR